MGALVIARVAERDGEAAHITATLLLRESGDQARVKTAGEIGPNRNVGAQAQPHAVAHELLKPGVAVARGLGLSALLRPPAARGGDLSVLPDDEGARRDLPDAAE